MEPRTVTCSCGKKLRIPEGYSKSVARCPRCKSIIHLEDETQPLELAEAETPQEHLRKVVGSCQVCGKSVTLQQREKYGYYCNDECLQRGKELYHPIAEEDAQAFEERARSATRNFLAGGAALLAVLALSITLYIVLRGHAKVAWQHELDSGVTHMQVSPRLVCFLGYDGTLHALDPARGELLWTHEAEDRGIAPGAFLPAGDTCIVAQGGTVKALHWRTGDVLWERQPGGPPLEISTDVEPDEEGYGMAMRYEFGDHNRVIPLLSLENGTVIVVTGGSDLRFPLTSFSGYFGTSKPSSKKLLALDLATGEPRWELDLGQSSPLGVASIGGNVGLALPVESDYDSFDLTVLDAATGNPISEPMRLESFAFSLKDGSGFCAGDGEIFIRCDQHLKCIRVDTHDERWSKHVGGMVTGPIYHDERVFLATPSQVAEIPEKKGTLAEAISSYGAGDYQETPLILTCFRADNGEKLWEEEFNSTDLMCAGGKIIGIRKVTVQPVSDTPANQEYFFVAYSARTGKKLWESKHAGVPTTSLMAVGDMAYYAAHDFKMARTSLLMGSMIQEGPMNHRIMAVRMR